MLPDPTVDEVKSLSSSQTLDAPDAKKMKAAEVSVATTSQTHAVVASKPVLSDIIDDGELGSAKVVAAPIVEASGPKSAEELNPDLLDDGRPICSYDDECYRKNPTHFKQFRHPRLMENRRIEAEASNGSKPAVAAVAAPSVSPAVLASPGALKRAGSSGVGLSASQMATTAVRPEIELYKTAMKSVLGGQSKISSEGRKLLKMFRQTHAVTEQEHDVLLGQYGWTPDEYEDGEKNQALFELDEERDFLRANGPEAFKIFTLFKHQKKNHQQESVWARASSKFYQTMSKAQANFVIKSIGLVVNAKVNATYEARKAAMFTASGGKVPINEEWGFHGTSEASIQAIAATGFKMPDELKKLQKGKAAKKGDKVTFLDDGYFGAGLYFSLYSDYALYYSEERGSSQILLCKVLTGKAFKCPDRMDGEGLKKGYDSHYSPLGNEIIVFKGDQVLPRYIITFEQREAHDPEQED
jgi:aprataxin and PNK-like factor